MILIKNPISFYSLLAFKSAIINLLLDEDLLVKL